jgi:hypothetical protein
MSKLVAQATTLAIKGTERRQLDGLGPSRHNSGPLKIINNGS